MSTQSNVYSQGGGGSQFEFEVHTAYFTLLLIGGYLPGVINGKLVAYRQQAGSLGYKTDDLFLKTEDAQGTQARHLYQIKHGLTISENNDTWKDVLLSLWEDFKNPSLFDKSTDTLNVIKSHITQDESRHLLEILSWAKVKTNEADFLNEVSRIGGKLKYWNQFIAVLNAKGVSPTNTELFEFLKCLNIIAYDFGQQASINKFSFLNLIELAKSESVTLTSPEIWAKLYTFVSGADSKGGMFEWNKIDSTFTSLFKPNYFPQIQKQLLRITEQSEEILAAIQDTIGGISLNRADLIEEGLAGIEISNIHIVAGDPGAGKSVISKCLVTHHANSNENLLVLKADELLEGNFSDILATKGLHLSLREFFLHFPLAQTHFIYIDALEKLLEGEADAFKQLLSSIKGLPNIKLLTSCRTANLNLLQIKFFSSSTTSQQKVGNLDDKELLAITEQLPELKPLIENKRLSSLIKVPKYLDFAYKVIRSAGTDFSSSSETEFTELLWEIIVENKLNDKKNGMPLKRKETFIAIAVKRARAMLPFVDAVGLDQEALQKLEDDQVIIRAKGNLYAPAHDVLEDWALTRFVDQQYSQQITSIQFFTGLGTEPAMRRSYRLWVQHALLSSDEQKIQFFATNLNDASIDKYWKEESLIAILQSKNCKIFFEKNQQVLQDENFLFQVIHLLRTACKENKNSDWSEKYYVPVGDGWSVIINELHQRWDSLHERRYPVILWTLKDWSRKLHVSIDLPEEARAAGVLSLKLFDFFFAKGEARAQQQFEKDVVKLLFTCSESIKEELTERFQQWMALAEKDDRGADWREVRFAQEMIDSALDGLQTGLLPKALPDLVITLAKQRWLYKPPVSRNNDPFWHSSESQKAIESKRFGLSEEASQSFSAASSHRTFVLVLLRWHTEKAISFILELVNTATEEFLSHDNEGNRLQDKIIIKFPIQLPDGETRELQGIPNFWVSYRDGNSVPKVLGSVLMALETCLLELGEMGREAETMFDFCLDKFFRENTSILIMGVLSSVCQAHPLLSKKWLHVLYTNKAFTNWDVQRYTNDTMQRMLPFQADLYGSERMESGKLSHRTKYERGLRGFAIDATIYIPGFAEPFFQLIDKYRAEVDGDDIEWRKYLDEMDFRVWKLKEQRTLEDGKEVNILLPEYDPEIAEEVENARNNLPWDPQDGTDNYWMSQVMDGNDTASIERWLQIYQRYLALPAYNSFEHSPGMLAVVGVRYVWTNLDQDQKKWCADRIIKSIKEINYRGIKNRVSTYDTKYCCQYYPLLFQKPDCGKTKEELTKLMTQTLTTQQGTDNDHARIMYAVSEYYWDKLGSNEAQWKTWNKIVAYSRFSKQNQSRSRYHMTDEEAKAIKDKRIAFWAKDFQPVPLEEITKETCDIGLLAKTINILPSISPGKDAVFFIDHLLALYLAYEKERNSGSRRDDDSGSILELKYALIVTIPRIVLWNITSEGKDLLELVFKRLHNDTKKFDDLELYGTQLELLKKILEHLTLIAYEASYRNDQHISEPGIANFGETLKQYDALLVSHGSIIMSGFLLLNIKWHTGFTHWPPVTQMKPLMDDLLNRYGKFNLPALINFLYHPGQQTYLPAGITLLADATRAGNGYTPLSTQPFISELVFKLYNEHFHAIRMNKKLLEDFLYVLNTLIDEGSSDAYWIREFMISFRSAS